MALTRKRIASLALVVVVCSGMFSRMDAQERRGADEHRELVERWLRKSPEERALLRERFEQLKSLPREDKAELHERARRLRELEQEARAEASESDRAEVERLPPQRARDFWRERAIARGRDAGRVLRERLPEDLRRRLENAPPSERREILRQLRDTEGDRRSRSALGDLGRRLDLLPDEIKALEALPLRERFAAIIELKRRHIEQRVREEGLPPSIDERRWERLRKMDDERFIETFDRLRERARPPRDERRRRGFDGDHERRERR